MKKFTFTLLALLVTAACFASTVSGPDSVCVGSTITLTGTPSGGLWASTNPSIATVGSTGIVTGISPGVDTITYFVSGTTPSFHVITVNPDPAAIAGMATACTGGTSTLTDATAGGTWTSSNPAVATIGSVSGVVTAISAGTTTITYMLPTGCYTTIPFTVSAGPAAITGPDSLCVGTTIVLSDATPGGTWSSSNPGIASVGSTGVVTGISAGTATITYSVPGSTGTTCYVVRTVVVLPSPCTLGVSAVVPGDGYLKIYPNPAYDELTIETGTGYNTYTVTTEVGKIARNGALSKQHSTLSVRELPGGLYFITLRGAAGAITQRFIKY